MHYNIFSIVISNNFLIVAIDSDNNLTRSYIICGGILFLKKIAANMFFMDYRNLEAMSTRIWKDIITSILHLWLALFDSTLWTGTTKLVYELVFLDVPTKVINMVMINMILTKFLYFCSLYCSPENF